MDARTASHILNQIGSLLDLTGAPRFNAKAYKTAARAVLATGADDLAPLLSSGELQRIPGLGPATISVIRDLVETGESSYLERLAESAPRGLLEIVRVPGLGLAKAGLIHRELGVESLDELEEAARDGRLAKLPRFGPKTAERVLAGIEFARKRGNRTLYHRGLAQAVILRDSVERHPDVTEAIIAGDVRRHVETIEEIAIVAVCSADPDAVAGSFVDAPGVKSATRDGPRTIVRYVDDTVMSLWCATPADRGITLWAATGSDSHVRQLTEFAKSHGLQLGQATRSKPLRKPNDMTTEAGFFEAIGIADIPPELREGMGEIEAAAARSLPDLIVSEDIKGALHCHTTWSDGDATIAEMAQAARDRGWKYIGITDHSQAAFYAGGMKPDEVRRQHDEIDELNAGLRGFRILKGSECDILSNGKLDYDDETLDSFDFIVGSVHSQFKMDRSSMTARILSAMDDPRMTVLGHATGRLLLSRQGYEVDVDAVIDKAVETGTALELNCDPHRMDLDWRLVRKARDRGVVIEIGPDAHSTSSLDNVEMGVGMARKAWLSAGQVLNARPAAKVVAFANAKRNR
jgi:DNA polymerase (family 10)